MKMEELASERQRRERGDVILKKKMVKVLLEEALKSIEGTSDDDEEDDTDIFLRKSAEGRDGSPRSSSSCSPNSDADEVRLLIRSRVGGPEFLEKMQNAISIQRNVPAEEGNSWDVVSDSDISEAGNVNTDQEDYIVVHEEDIVDGMACFMAAYLSSLKETPKDLTPNQLQKALCKTFSVKKNKGKLRKALDGSKVIYNVASWSATAIGIYQNPALLRAASTAFWTSCRVISRLF